MDKDFDQTGYNERLMTGPVENREFCFLRISKQNQLFLSGLVLK